MATPAVNCREPRARGMTRLQVAGVHDQNTVHLYRQCRRVLVKRKAAKAARDVFPAQPTPATAPVVELVVPRQRKFNLVEWAAPVIGAVRAPYTDKWAVKTVEQLTKRLVAKL